MHSVGECSISVWAVRKGDGVETTGSVELVSLLWRICMDRGVGGGGLGLNRGRKDGVETRGSV